MKTQEEHYNYFINNYKPADSLYVGWSSAEKQHTCFKQIVKTMKQDHSTTVLDVGCGVGALTEYFYPTRYTGIDINPEYVLQAKLKAPTFKFLYADLKDHYGEYDYAIACGTFNLKQDNNMRYLIENLERMYNLANVGIIFNLTSKFCLNKVEDIHYYDPGLILNMCLDHGWRAAINHEYLYDDFTVHILK